ncbi:MAG: O-antigen ligase family protein [bacterium]|nr:O-antigen ligase family protein [bacterium]
MGEQSIVHSVLALIFLFLVGIAAIAAVFFTRGAGAMVAVVAGFIALVAFKVWKSFVARHARGIAVTIVVGWVAACLLITAWLPFQPERPRDGSTVWQKLTFQQWSGSVRLSQYREMWGLLADHPVRGAGLAGYPIAIQQYKEKQDVETFVYPHNLLLAVWSELGLLGLLIFLVLLIVFFTRAFATWRSASIIAAMCALLIFGLVDIPTFKNDLAIQFWTLLALGTLPLVPTREFSP